MAECRWPKCPNKALDDKVYCVRHLQGADKSKTRPKHTRTVGEWMSDLFMVVGPALLILLFISLLMTPLSAQDTFNIEVKLGCEVHSYTIHGDGESLIGIEYTIKIRGKVVERGFGVSTSPVYYVRTEEGVLTQAGFLTYRILPKLNFYWACLPIKFKK